MINTLLNQNVWILAAIGCLIMAIILLTGFAFCFANFKTASRVGKTFRTIYCSISLLQCFFFVFWAIVLLSYDMGLIKTLPL